MLDKTLCRCRSSLCRLLLANSNGFVCSGRIVLLLTTLLTISSWLSFYGVVHRGRPAAVTPPSVLFQKRYLPIGGADLQFDQPWEPAKTRALTGLAELHTGERFILSDLTYSPGLGNLMFEFAALHYFAEQHNATIVIPSNCLLLRAFSQLGRVRTGDARLLTAYMLRAAKQQVPTYESKGCCEFATRFDLFRDNQNIIIVKGYFQTYDYFEPQYRKQILGSFRFLPGVMKRAEHILRNLSRTFNTRDNCTFIGIHVRHGMDVTLHSRNLHHGHVTAPREYFDHAIRQMHSMLPNQKLVFLVAGDDLKWANESLQQLELFSGNLQFVNSGFREVDMAVLTLCNHTIMSTGSFSWWVAYLTQGKTIYYGGWPKPGSVLSSMVSKSNYFPYKWIPVI